MENRSANNKLNSQLVKRLRSEDEMTVLKALGELRSKGNLAYVPELLNVLNVSGSETVQRELVRFLADIREKAVIPYIIDSLRDPRLKTVHHSIISACWQSGIDYSAHLNLFIEIFLAADYMTSLESFSVIEQSLEHLTNEEITHKRELLLKGLDKVSEEKKPLASELVNLLQV